MIVFTELQQRGIHIDDIHPGENVLTFHAWRALGRSVKKGEKGIKVITWVPCGEKTDKQGNKTESKRPKTAYVFHISQTVELKGGKS
jgi:antirestriction protein ArdC